jgi:hypothetical protein
MNYGHGQRVWYIKENRIVYVHEDLQEGTVWVSNNKGYPVYQVYWDDIRELTPLEELL